MVPHGDLPSIDIVQAIRGAVIFETHCAECHGSYTCSGHDFLPADVSDDEVAALIAYLKTL